MVNILHPNLIYITFICKFRFKCHTYCSQATSPTLILHITVSQQVSCEKKGKSSKVLGCFSDAALILVDVCESS